MATTYTICDSEKEQKCLSTLVKLADLIQTHNQIIKDESKKQEVICGKLWSFSQRLAILRRGIPGCRICPIDLSHQVECEILNDFHNSFVELNKSTKVICKSFKELQLLLKRFNNEVQSLDVRTQSSLVTGNEKQKPLQFYIDFINDAIDCFQNFLLTIRNLTQFIKVDDSYSIEKFQNFLKADSTSELDVTLSMLSLPPIRNKRVLASGKA